MAIEIKRNRGVEVKDKEVWAYTVEEFTNGDGQLTQRVIRNRIKKKDIPIEKQKLRESREQYHKSLNHLNNYVETIDSNEYKDWIKEIKEGKYKNFYDCYVQSIQLENNKQIKSVTEWLDKQKKEIESALNELNEYQEQIKEMSNILK